MEKRAMLAFVLSLIVLFGYQYLILPKSQNRGELIQPSEIETKERLEPVKVVPEEQKTEQKEFSRMIPSQKEEISEELILVETDLVWYYISTRDAMIKGIILKKYKDESGEPVQLTREGTDYYPLQMISEGKSFAINFTPSQKNLRILENKETGKLVMSYKDPEGAAIEKIFIFRRDSYEVEVNINQNILSEYQLLVGSYLQSDGEKSGRYAHIGPVLEFQGEIKRLDLKDIKDQKVFPGEISWIAFEDKYFMTALIPEIKRTEALADRFKKDENFLVVFGITAKGENLSYRFFAGPKDYELLKSYGLGLEKAINFGWFGFLAKPMFYILKTMYRFVGNYGVAIILLTTLIKIFFWPLTHKQQSSMKDMQKVQPEINAIREKYKNDTQRMNREVMGLYKKYKINPAAGCLPLVIQIPVFFALYNVLLNAIELRGAAFLYISDLSAADTLFGHIAGFSVGPLPLLMGVSMYVQQKMMPSTMDPRQAKIFQFMPIIFTFMFLNFPSGLVLYWLVNNLLTIFQQFKINQKNKEAKA